MKVQTHYEEGTPEGVRIALEQAIKNGPDHRYRIFYGDPATGKDYGEEQDVIGWISRSTGEQKVPIILAQKNSSFGSPIHTRIVVKIIHTNVNRVVYRHPRYDPGEYTILRELSHPNLPIAY